MRHDHRRSGRKIRALAVGEPQLRNENPTVQRMGGLEVDGYQLLRSWQLVFNIWDVTRPRSDL
jgi:hypothetical protein